MSFLGGVASLNGGSGLVKDLALQETVVYCLSSGWPNIAGQMFSLLILLLII